jgi:tetratricopeptide (TPR) repeat protein
MHRKYCCTEHQKEAWKDHKTICNVYKKLGLGTNTDPEDTALELLQYSQELTFGREVRLELALRVNIEALALSKHFGLSTVSLCLLQIGGVLGYLEKFDEAEIFGRDAVAFARDVAHDAKTEIQAADTLAKVLLEASKLNEAIEFCDHYLELYGSEDSNVTNSFCRNKSAALSGLNRNEEALAQLAFVRTSTCTIAADWMWLSISQEQAGQLPEAIHSAEKAVELCRAENPQLDVASSSQRLAGSYQRLAVLCKVLANLYQKAGRSKEARRLAREAKSLS